MRNDVSIELGSGNKFLHVQNKERPNSHNSLVMHTASGISIRKAWVDQVKETALSL